MPFTLAHPAAVLPLRRYCPRFLNYPALIIGSLVPDIGYCFPRLNLDEFSHRFVGSIEFCLPVGVLMLVLFYGLRARTVGILPERHRRVFLPLCQRQVGSLLLAVVSLLIGIWTHLLLDALTHKGGWLVAHMSMLQSPIVTVGGHTVRVHHLLWYACSFLGVAWLCLAYERWWQAPDRGGTLPLTRVSLRNAVLAAALVVPIEVIHHLTHGPIGVSLVAASTALLVIGVVLRIGNNR